MSWLTGAPTTLADLVVLRPGLAEDHVAIETALWELTHPSPVTLELCRLRIAGLVGAASETARRTPAAAAAGLTEDRIRRLAAWPTDPQTTAEEHIALTLAEQLLMDAHGVAEADVERGREVLGDAGLVGLMVALAIFEGSARAAAILDASPGGSDGAPDG